MTNMISYQGLVRTFLSILLTQKYDILVININNFSSSQIDALEEILKNGVYKNKKDSVPISTTFWVYAAKPYIRNEYVRNDHTQYPQILNMQREIDTTYTYTFSQSY